MKQRLARLGFVFVLLSSPVVAIACDQQGGEDEEEVEQEVPNPEDEEEGGD